MWCHVTIARSPVFTHVSSSMVGIHTIRAFDLQHVFHDEFNRHLVSILSMKCVAHIGICITFILSILYIYIYIYIYIYLNVTTRT